MKRVVTILAIFCFLTGLMSLASAQDSSSRPSDSSTGHFFVVVPQEGMPTFFTERILSEQGFVVCHRDDQSLIFEVSTRAELTAPLQRFGFADFVSGDADQIMANARVSGQTKSIFHTLKRGYYTPNVMVRRQMNKDILSGASAQNELKIALLSQKIAQAIASQGLENMTQLMNMRRKTKSNTREALIPKDDDSMVGWISGRVTSPGGKGLAGIYAIAGEANSLQASYTQTNADGTYKLEVYRGSHVLIFINEKIPQYLMHRYYNGKDTLKTADRITVTGGQTLSGIDCVLPLAGMISGRVTNSQGNGIENIKVWVTTSFEEFAADPYYSFTNKQGRYLVGGQRTGQSKIFFDTSLSPTYMYESYDDKTGFDFDKADWIPVTVGQTTRNIDATLERAAVIKGKVTSEAGRGIRNLLFINATEQNSRMSYSTKTEPTRGHENMFEEYDGSYTLGNLPSGQYTVEFVNPFPFLTGPFQSIAYDQIVIPDVNDENYQPDILDLKAGETYSGIDAVMPYGTGLSGKLKNRDGSPIDLTQNIHLIIPRIFTLNGTILEPHPTQIWTKDGYWECGLMKPGRYAVFFESYGKYYPSDSLPTFIEEWYDHQPNLASATVIDVAKREFVRNIDITLTPALAVTLSGESQTDRSWLKKKRLITLHLTIENNAKLPIGNCKLLRIEGEGLEETLVAELPYAQFVDNQAEVRDENVQIGVRYTYLLRVLGEGENQLGQSKSVTIE